MSDEKTASEYIVAHYHCTAEPCKENNKLREEVKRLNDKNAELRTKVNQR